MNAIRPIPVTVFIDWNGKIHDANPPTRECMAVAKHTLYYVGRSIGRVLHRIDASARFDVSLRIYHGWYKGFEQTDNRRAIIEVAAGADFPSLSSNPNVLIRQELSYGDRLLSAHDKRLHTRLGLHLPNTLRRSTRLLHHATKGAEFEEKMVDTALASDIVYLAHRERDTWILVMGDDDDLVPPVFTAEAIRGPREGRVFIVRKRPEGTFLKLDGVLEAL